MDRVEFTESEALAAIIDEVIAYSSKPKPPENSFTIEDYCRRIKETEGRSVSVTAARRVLFGLEEIGFLESELFQMGAKRPRYWWIKNGTDDDNHGAFADRKSL